MDKKEYAKLVKKVMPKTEHFKTMILAFVTGGIVCMIGQGIFDILSLLFPALSEKDLNMFALITLITITGILTAVGVYDKFGNLAGAGSVIPIAGFANAVISPAIEHKSEGIVLGVCDNMFTIAGPVIVFGTSASILLGFIVLIFRSAFGG
ncbi:MAG: stage V sporulation protein AC [Christensenellales bacterium]|jgi:stage V sporulation protein AC